VRKLFKIINNLIPYFLNKFNYINFGILDPYPSLILENLYAIINNKSVRFFYEKDRKIFIAKDKPLTKFYFNKIRFFRLYRNGIKERGKSIHKIYCLDKINFNTNDIIIDCGANSGDLYIAFKKHIIGSNYIGIEPNPTDFNALKLNCPKGKLFNMALADKNTKLDFYISSNRGESSIIKPKIYEDIISVDVIKIGDLVKKLKIKKIKLLKIVAEGCEKDILEGAEEILPICEFIAIHVYVGWYERDIKQGQTFRLITNKLIKNNFEIYDIKFPGCRVLFKNLSL